MLPLPRPDATLFLASSVHDMKNSISVLLANLQSMLAQAGPEHSGIYQEMAQMLYETQRINGNLIHLLTLYKLGNDLYPFRLETYEMKQFAETVTSRLLALFKTRNLGLEVDVPEEVYWEFDGDLVDGILVHAMNNAANYTHSRIALSIQPAEGALEFRVEDDGDGFPQRMLDEGVAAMRGVDFSTGSTGLGLYFAAVAARMHRSHKEEGSIRLENGGRLGGGCFILRLP
ncbi:MAG: HAMP domain-containing sensor histidine kinase [Azovibrio sp.]|uniref:sensor histidine kinase n=1 Tax=Azovibrio sp. TaxID=1872673 RepID=UPI003C734C32